RIAMFQVGLDYRLRPNLILGFTVLADTATRFSDDLGYRIGGQGWMFGPYAAVRFADSIVLDGKVLWGRSTNAISPFLTYTDTFTTERLLATMRLGGEIAFGKF